MRRIRVVLDRQTLLTAVEWFGNGGGVRFEAEARVG